MLPSQQIPMDRPSQTAKAPALEEIQYEWAGLKIQISTQDISRSTAWRIHDLDHVLVMHLSGQMDELETEWNGRGGRSERATPGEIWTVPADTLYSSQARGGLIRFAALSIPPRLQGSDEQIFWSMKLHSGFRDDLLHRMLQRFLRVGENDDVAGLQRDSLSQAILGHVRNRYSARPRLSCKGDQAIPLTSHEVRSLRDYIFDNLTLPMSLSRLAQRVGLTPHQFLIAFRSAFGTTSAQYVIAERLRRAEWYLLHTSWDITTIALKTGFSSHSHLTRTFTRRRGYPPQQFRQRLSGPTGLAIESSRSYG